MIFYIQQYLSCGIVILGRIDNVVTCETTNLSHSAAENSRAFVEKIRFFAETSVITCR